MQIVHKLDAGDMLHKEEYTITNNDTASMLHDTLATLGAIGLAKVLTQIDSGGIQAEVQDEHLVTYAEKLSKSEAVIDWQQSAHEIALKVRGLNAWPVAQTLYQDKVLRIWSSEVIEASDQQLLALTPGTNIAGQTIFDLDTAYVGTNGPGGETTHSVQRKLITKLAHASNYIATEGRVGPAQFAITNGGLAAALQDIAGYSINPVKSKMNSQGQLYPVGSIGDISIYVDPYMRYNDNRIVIGRKNNPDQPGVIFVPYLMAQSISVISEATFAPRMLLRSRYAITEVGWFPQKQFMTIQVYDGMQYLN